MQWLDALSSVCATLSRAYILVLACYGIRRRLNPEIKFVAIVCILDYLLATLPETIDLGMRFTHWTLGPRLQSWSFSVAGTSITVTQAFHSNFNACIRGMTGASQPCVFVPLLKRRFRPLRARPPDSRQVHFVKTFAFQKRTVRQQRSSFLPLAPIRCGGFRVQDALVPACSQVPVRDSFSPLRRQSPLPNPLL